MRLRSVHPGVTVADVVAARFAFGGPGDVPATRLPTDDELRWIADITDPLRGSPRRKSRSVSANA